jgi:hypothetical protein
MFTVGDVRGTQSTNYVFETDKGARKYAAFLVSYLGWEEETIRIWPIPLISDVDLLIQQVAKNMGINLEEES